jgi:signal transduction histidine kinase
VNYIRRLSISTKITMGSLVVAILLGIIAVLIVRVGVASILRNATVTLLTNDAAPYVSQLRNDPSGQLYEPVEGQLIAVLTPKGGVLVSTLPHGIESHLPFLESAKPGIVDVPTFRTSYLIKIQDVPTSVGTYRVIVARNDETAALILSRLTYALVGGAIALVLCLALASWVLARLALRPVNRMRKQANVIAENSSTGLLPVGAAQDELAALATTLNDLIARLRASADREKQLVSDASHELRTPLAVLQGQLELAELDAGDAERLLEDVRSSHATVLRLSGLATNLLELSRIDAAASPGTADWRTLTAELADAIDHARTVAGPDVVIDFDYEPRGSAGPMVAMAGPDFGRVLANLLTNAIRAVGDSGTISANLTAGDARVRLTVVDSGPGMPADFIPIALDRFTRAEGTGYAGGGLGLAIVAALVGAAGGRVALSNQSPHGLAVVVDLPATAPAV